MRKLASLVAISAMLAVTLSACGSDNNDSSGNTSAGNSDAKANTSTNTSTNTSNSSSGNNAAADNKADSGSNAAAADPGEVVTIRTSITEGELSKDQIAEFEAAHPNIKVEIDNVDATKLAAELATGDAPDIIRISGAFEVSNYVIKGLALDLTPYIDSSTVINKDDLVPIADVFRFDGKTIGQGPIYGLPKDWSNDFALFYNKKVFDAAGVEVPDASKPLTWPEVMDLAKKLTKKEGGKVTQYGLAATEWGLTEPNFNQMLQYLLSSGASISSADNATMDFNQPAVKDYINMWTDAVKSNVGPNSVNNDQTNGGTLFLDDKAGLLIDGYWYSGVIRGNEKAKAHLDDFGMLPTPIAPGGTRVAPTGGATGGIIYSGSKHPKEAWTFFEWFFGGKPADDRAKTGWGLPIFKSKMGLLPQETNFDKQTYGVLQDELNYSSQYLQVNPYLGGGGWAIFSKYVTPIFFGKSTVDDAVAGMTKDANVAVTEAKSAIGQ
ncbi:ABC transporter substrate-binding protein [Paenibacillus albus]|uniref:Sugar ABC transporter substrate-binding protein n=1 Tax=Paenibacillus albus TaxID=2495582 RepID=A0A3S9A0K4_9BACL|nr:sugar ABC transporter substrate-binding protein [Paenibacillus albus]AZN39307.1 sugar ABC transporter substrate-binding protein [Paenibacillus albus]